MTWWENYSPGRYHAAPLGGKEYCGCPACCRYRLERDTALRSPVAALLNSKQDESAGFVQYLSYYDVRAAIKAQAELWRREAAECEAIQHYTAAEAYGRCADELEGK